MKKFIKNYKSTLILLGAIIIGAIVGLIFEEKATVLSPFGDLFLNLLFIIIVPFVLRYGYGYTWMFHNVEWSIPYFALTVGIGEIISVCGLGGVLLNALLPYKNVIFKNN